MLNPIIRFSRKSAALLAAPLLAAMLATAAAPVPAMAEETHITISANAYGATRRVDLVVNKSLIIDLPAGVAEVVVSEPTVAGAIMRSWTRAILQGMTGGITNIFFLDDAGRTIQILDVQVMEGASQVGSALEAALALVIPGSNIHVESVALNGATNRIVLTGTVLSTQDRDRAMAVAVQFAPPFPPIRGQKTSR